MTYYEMTIQRTRAEIVALLEYKLKEVGGGSVGAVLTNLLNAIREADTP